MQSRLALVTGSCGLIGSEVCLYFSRNGYRIAGVYNNQRAVVFGPEGDSQWAWRTLRESIPGYRHYASDIRDRAAILSLVADLRPSAIHTAAQPSHDRAAAIPFDDFNTNATETLNLLEAVRRAVPESPFIHMSTNKVYGDLPNSIPLSDVMV
jgi:CDP-paratose 2-epimerase